MVQNISERSLIVWMYFCYGIYMTQQMIVVYMKKKN